MILLILFAFIAGIVTILSPCILPVLPIILSSSFGGRSSGKARPLGVITGFVLSFTFFTLFLSAIVQLSGIQADVLRNVSVIIVAGFGISLLIPKMQQLLELFFSKISQLVPQGNTRSGFGSGVLVGLSLGLLWTPCVGPILASVISLALTESVTFNTFLITLSYSLGTALPMLLIMVGGQKLLQSVPWLRANTAKIQKAFGVLMILTAIGVYTGLDRKFQTFILDTFPQYGVGLTKFEEIAPIQNELNNLNGSVSPLQPTEPAGSQLPASGEKAPEIVTDSVWFNSPPLSLADLKGKVVIVDFWTYSCINCQRTLPYLNNWWQKYKDDGLVIIGVHAPEFEFEKSAENLKKAITDFGLTYPIVQDNNFITWRAYNNHYWPAKYIIDKNGFIRYTHFGEGAYDESEQVIQTLLKETGIKSLPEKTHNPDYQVYANTPEIYLGYNRMDYFASPEKINPDMISTYTIPQNFPFNTFAFEGTWIVTGEYANPQTGAKLYLNFDAKQVYLVMSPSSGTATLKATIDGQAAHFGQDNNNGTIVVDANRLYRLIDLPSPGRHFLTLEFEDSNAQLFAFTFG